MTPQDDEVCAVGRGLRPDLPACPVPPEHEVTVIRQGHYILCDRHFQMMVARLPPGAQIQEFRHCAAGRSLIHTDKPGWAQPCPLEGLDEIVVLDTGTGQDLDLWLCPEHSAQLPG